MEVHILGKGNAVASSSGQSRRRRSLNPNILTIEMAVTAVEPASGGTAGGTVLSIAGSGFGTSNSDVNVLVGGVECEVELVMATEIVCKTGAHDNGTVDIVVTSNDISATLHQKYTYDPSLEARITGFSPNQGPVYGGSVLTISGSGFPEVDSELEVMVGGNHCEVQSTTATQITCVLPRNPPGGSQSCGGHCAEWSSIIQRIRDELYLCSNCE